LRITNQHTSSSWESVQTKTAEDFDPERVDDNSLDLFFFGLKKPSLRTSYDDTPISSSLNFVFSFSSFFSSCSWISFSLRQDPNRHQQPTDSLSYLYQDNLIASKVIIEQTKTKQLKHLLSKINLAQTYHADKLYEIIQTSTDEMIADSLTKPKSAYNYVIIEAARLGLYQMPNY